MSSLSLTPQQQAILQALDVSVAVSAGAGCGKTFVLTQRFLAFLESASHCPDPLSRIVAITFTERAAREMRHRVRTACQTRLLRCTSAEVPHWLAVLRGLDAARISTIHSYCSSLLRTYAVEAGLDPAFGLLESTFGDTFARRAVRDGLCRLLESRDADARELVFRFGFERATTLLRELIDGLNLVDSALMDSHTPHSLCEAWRAYWVEECLPGLVRDFWTSPAVRRVVELLQAHEPNHPVMRERRSRLLELLSNAPCSAPSDVALALQTLRDCAQVRGGGTKSAWLDETVYAEVMTAFKALRDRIDELLKRLAIAEGDGTAAATLALTAHRVARHVAGSYAARKRDESRLDFDDLLCLARDLLRDHPAVRRRAAASIDLLMVDEFQDTDPVQAELVRYLCGEGLTTGRLFLVGDTKQSIYRFRRADPRVFEALRNDLPEKGRLPLTTNFRSQPAILRFVNYTFAPEMANYEPLEPAIPLQLSPEPSIEFLFAPAEEEKEKEKADALRRREARWIARRIAALLAETTPRIRNEASNSLRPVQKGDVAILFRTLSNVHLYEQALVEQGLDYYLAGGRAFFAQQEIYDVAHLCRWLADPADELSLAGVLRSPFFGLNDDTLYALKPEKKASLLDGLSSPPSLPETQAEQVARAHRVLTELRSKKDRLPLGDLLSLAVERTGYDAALLCEHLGPRKLANLRKLIGLARHFDAAGSFTLSEFVDRLRDAVREQADEELAVTHPEVGNVIRLMTIHQAKGLEFPVVVLADMDWRRPGGHSPACYHPTLGPLFSLPDDGDQDESAAHLGLLISRLDAAREEQFEQVRLLYVATTRAKDHLILSAGIKSHDKVQSSWMQLLARRFDLMTGLPAVDPYLGSAGGKAFRSDDLPQIFVHHAEPVLPQRGKKPRTDHAPLRQFRELVQNAAPAPLPPLIGRLQPDLASRREFSVTALCQADRDMRGERSEVDPPSPGRRPRNGHLPFEDSPGESSSDYARLVGSITHAVLERLDFADSAALAPRQIAELVERAILSFRGETDRDLQRRVSNKVVALLDSPLRKELASARRLHRELEFLLRWDRPEIGRPAEITGTIDVLYQTSDARWHLLDYKAVEDTGQDEASLIECYELQLSIYALAVERLIGTPPDTARLVRLGPPTRVLRVPVTAEALAFAVPRIDSAIAQLRGV